MKYVIYQQGARGYGRIARSIKLMNVLNDIEDSTGLIFSGDSLLNDFKLPDNVSTIQLPQIYKGLNKSYSTINSSLGLSDCLKQRSQIIKQAIISFKPNIFFIDSIPTGVLDELKDLIIWIKKYRNSIKIILIVRDIIDSSSRTVFEWKRFDVYKFLENYYDLIFVLGNQIVFDFCKEYQLSKNLCKKLVYCNYFSSNYILKSEKKKLSDIDILLTVGGGIDGFNLVNSFVKVYKKEKWDLKVVIIFGQQFPVETKNRLKIQLPPNIETIDHTMAIYDYYLKSKLIICMGGYNTITEILALQKHPIVIPRKTPTREQVIRARRLMKLSLVSMVNLNKKNELKNLILLKQKTSSMHWQKIQFNLKEIIEINLKKILKINLN